MYSQEEIIEKFIKLHGNKYDYSKVDFRTTTQNVCIICPEHGEFWQSPHAHLKGQGCPKCGLLSRVGKKSYTTDLFIQKAKEIYGDKYDYSKVEYVDSVTKVTIICPVHGEVAVRPDAFLFKKNGCPKCQNKNKGNFRKLSLSSFVERSIKKHGDKYDYSKVIYNNSTTPVEIICPIHGSFYQAPYIHMSGHGCPLCGREQTTAASRSNTKEFIEKATKTHGNKYDYSKVNYLSVFSPVEIICPTHGSFFQKPLNHLSGCGCQKCGELISHQEEELRDFVIELLGPENVRFNARDVLANGKEIDILIPKLNIGIEYDGLYWHSEINQSDIKYHLNKTEECLKRGIALIHIFEDEWIYKKEICKSRLANLLGLTENKIYARKCIIKEIDSRTSNEFLNRNHIQGSIMSKYRYGLFYNNELVSVMTFGPLRKNLGRNAQPENYELLRFCNKLNHNVVGAASKLFKYFIKTKKPNEIISYADRRWSQGNLYDTLGFKLLHYSKPNYFYVINGKRKNRFGFRKNILIEKYGCKPEDTEHNFCLTQKWYRIYDCGTILYKWQNN